MPVLWLVYVYLSPCLKKKKSRDVSEKVWLLSRNSKQQTRHSELSQHVFPKIQPPSPSLFQGLAARVGRSFKPATIDPFTADSNTRSQCGRNRPPRVLGQAWNFAAGAVLSTQPLVQIPGPMIYHALSTLPNRTDRRAGTDGNRYSPACPRGTPTPLGKRVVQKGGFRNWVIRPNDFTNATFRNMRGF